jgi:hypothetical protein
MRNHMHQTPSADFFFVHAGYSFNPSIEGPIAGRVRGALELAYAARIVRLAGFTFEWDVDTDIDSSEFSDEEPAYPLWMCTMRDVDGDHYDTLGGVDFGRDGHPSSDAYRYVCEAEMALQNLSRIQDES